MCALCMRMCRCAFVCGCVCVCVCLSFGKNATERACACAPVSAVTSDAEARLARVYTELKLTQSKQICLLCVALAASGLYRNVESNGEGRFPRLCSSFIVRSIAEHSLNMLVVISRSVCYSITLRRRLRLRLRIMAVRFY